MVDDKVEADVVEVHLLDEIVEFGTLEDFESITIDVENPVSFNLGMTTLHQ